jgi:hypothetical protein
LKTKKYKIKKAKITITNELFFDDIRYATIEEKERYFREFNRVICE